ncbi:hypothetical protein LZ554_008917 [Drepanopeziza brunnea f. sp. 'monogermtubi']|nr:hypothetical protein LZ554_008917 [Drepanopeziza brunnea f. sp. 'monogermtubi']
MSGYFVDDVITYRGLQQLRGRNEDENCRPPFVSQSSRGAHFQPAPNRTKSELQSQYSRLDQAQHDTQTRHDLVPNKIFFVTAKFIVHHRPFRDSTTRPYHPEAQAHCFVPATIHLRRRANEIYQTPAPRGRADPTALPSASAAPGIKFFLIGTIISDQRFSPLDAHPSISPSPWALVSSEELRSIPRRPSPSNLSLEKAEFALPGAHANTWTKELREGFYLISAYRIYSFLSETSSPLPYKEDGGLSIRSLSGPAIFEKALFTPPFSLSLSVNEERILRHQRAFFHSSSASTEPFSFCHRTTTVITKGFHCSFVWRTLGQIARWKQESSPI